MFLRVLDSHQWLPGFVTSLTLLGHTKLRLGELPKNWTRPSKTSSFTNIPKTTGLAPRLSNINLVAVEYFSYFFLSQSMIVAPRERFISVILGKDKLWGCAEVCEYLLAKWNSPAASFEPLCWIRPKVVSELCLQMSFWLESGRWQMFFGQVVALTDSGAGQFVKRSNLRRFKISGCALFQKPIGHQVMTRALASRPFGKKLIFAWLAW